ncbi:MAG: DUF4142 domain-containing protein [Chitinophagaceae bacterium]|nr:MAG: DUF4142 domain-containing protein [Chitinophagaceae bacterium]
MKKICIALAMASFMTACNNEAKDPVEKADSTNEAKQDSMPKAVQTDEETTDFLVKAANGGMAEVNAGKMAESKATNAGVKRFASMMVNDHTGANSQVMALAAARGVTLPASVSEEKQKAAADLDKKTGKDFDKDYMDMQVKDHKETINLFEKGLDNSKDAEVKTFINNTLPKLKQHLDSAQAVQKMLK